MAIKLHGYIIGRLDQIRIYYYIGAILFRYSIIEEWVVNTLAQHIYGKDSVEEFTNKFRALSFGQKLQYLRGEDIVDRFFHTESSIAILNIYKSCSEYKALYSELERINTERNCFIHTSYFQGSGAEDWKMKFSSWRPKKKDGEFVHEVITPELMKSKYEDVVSDWKLVQKLNMQLSLCFVKKVQAHETRRN